MRLSGFMMIINITTKEATTTEAPSPGDVIVGCQYQSISCRTRVFAKDCAVEGGGKVA
jgi:hypothetical protein